MASAKPEELPLALALVLLALLALLPVPMLEVVHLLWLV